MTCSIESAIISDAAPKKYARNTGWRSAGNETAEFIQPRKWGQMTFSSRPVSQSGVELCVVTEDALLVEGDAALRLQVLRQPRALGDALMERDKIRIARLEGLHRSG